MSGYEEKMFLEWLELAKQLPAKHLFEELKLMGDPSQWSDELIASKLRFARVAELDSYKKLHDSELMNRFRRESGFNRAFESISGKRRRRSVDLQGSNTEEVILK